MKQADFESQHEAVWQRFADVLKDPGNSTGVAGDTLPALYRLICSHLALAKSRRYSPALVERLNNLATQGYFSLYGSSHRFKRLWLRFVVYDFPIAIARNQRYVLAAAMLFFLPLLCMGIAAYLNSDAIYTIYGPGDLREYESMYDPENQRVGRDRDSQDDWFMFGFYVYNNVGIAFRTFATGLLFGVGSAFVLVYNGLAIGGVGGHLTQAGYGVTFYPFVAGHSALELLGIVLSGAAGLKVGLSLLMPGNLSRIGALRIASREAAILVYGAGAMLLLAAALEAFWSSRTSLPPVLRLSVGGVLWLVLLSYLSSGRRLLSRAT